MRGKYVTVRSEFMWHSNCSHESRYSLGLSEYTVRPSHSTVSTCFRTRFSVYATTVRRKSNNLNFAATSTLERRSKRASPLALVRQTLADTRISGADSRYKHRQDRSETREKPPHPPTRQRPESRECGRRAYGQRVGRSENHVQKIFGGKRLFSCLCVCTGGTERSVVSARRK
jgi:hypothetical protein